MFWKKDKLVEPAPQEKTQYSYKFCYLYISEKYKQIMFVPYGKVEIGFHAELDNIISDTWPCDFGKLQMNIEETLNKYLTSTEYIKDNWPSYKNSKAKSQKSFEIDYVALRVETDITKGYGDGEVERIRVTAQPSSIEDTYFLVGSDHLLDTRIAQIVLDIFEACIKIRS